MKVYLAALLQQEREGSHCVPAPLLTTLAGDGEDDGVWLQFTASLRGMQCKALRAIGK